MDLSIANFPHLEAPSGRRLTYLPEPWVNAFLQAVLDGNEYPALPFSSFAPKTILDIGAHVGAAALYFADRYPEACIHCFEPNPNTFALLRYNTASIKKIMAYAYGLGAKAQTARLYAGVHSTMQTSFLPNNENTQEAITVSIKNVESVLTQIPSGGAVLVKLDTEGMELEILHALSGHLPSIAVLYIEYHSEADRRAIDALLGNGYALFHASVAEPDRGVLGYVSVRLLEALREHETVARYAWPKPAPEWT